MNMYARKGIMKKATTNEQLIEMATVMGKVIRNCPVSPLSINTSGRKAITMAKVDVERDTEDSVALFQAASKRLNPRSSFSI
jgi:hypothetical protein